MARPLRTTSYTESGNYSDVVKYEHGGTYGRETVTIISGAGTLEIGTVVAQITKGAATSAAKAGGNTGNGTLTLDATTPKLVGCKAGVYAARCIVAATNGGVFQVVDPDGIMLGTVQVGGTFATQIKFALADGSTDFVVGDGFDITIAAGSGKWKKHISGAVDGTEVAGGILISVASAASADVPQSIILVRHAEVRRQSLIWDASVDSEAKKDAALATLAARGIIARAGA